MNQSMAFEPSVMLTLAQSLQLVGLAPCLFVVLFLLVFARLGRQAFIPAAYFTALACGFALPLIGVFLPDIAGRAARDLLLLGDSMLAAFGFLLILQFMLGRVPPTICWLVLAIPLAGGAALLSFGLEAEQARTLYNVISSSLVFLLLVYYATRHNPAAVVRDADRHKYWLVIALILLHLLVLAVELAQLAAQVTPERALLIETVFRLTFIYLVLTSLFRVFYPSLMAEALPEDHKRFDPEAEEANIKRIRGLLEVDRVYREMRLNRAALARKVAISEHHLSRILNRHFGKSFNELINGYRIDEAKIRLRNEPTQITVIAFDVGFNSIASFNRVFKEKVGVSPTEYRANNQS